MNVCSTKQQNTLCEIFVTVTRTTLRRFVFEVDKTTREPGVILAKEPSILCIPGDFRFKLPYVVLHKQAHGR